MEENQPKRDPKKKPRLLGFAFLGDTFGRFFIREEEKDYFAENLALLINSGMGIVSVLEAVKSGTGSGRLRRIIEEIKNEIDAGSSLWRAMDKAKILPPQAISLLRIGEESGRLPQNLKVIVLEMRKDRAFKAKIRSAAIYPILVLVLTFTIGIGIAWFTLPRLAAVFSQLNLKLPLATKALIAVGKFLGVYGAIAVPLFVSVFAVLIYFIFFFKRTQFIGQAFLFHLPGVRGLIKKTELARLGYTLGSLLQAGVPIVETVNSLERSTAFYVYKRFYKSLGENIEEGNSFKKIFRSYPALQKLIPLPIQEMLIAAEESGRLPETLLTIGQTFEDELEAATKDLAAVLEPILLVIVWLGVVSVALAVILPIYSLIGGLNEPAAPVSPRPPVAPPQEIKTITEAPSKLLEVLPSELGYVNVRDNPSRQGKIVAKVLPGEIHTYREEKDGWYEIVFQDGRSGWVSGKYAKVINP